MLVAIATVSNCNGGDHDTDREFDDDRSDSDRDRYSDDIMDLRIGRQMDRCVYLPLSTCQCKCKYRMHVAYYSIQLCSAVQRSAAQCSAALRSVV